MTRNFPTRTSFGYLKALLVGLSIAQVIATIQVYQSNFALHAKIKEVLAAGWLSVPTGKALESLKAFGSAAWGGLFFTLSVGAILTLASMAASNLTHDYGRQKGLYRHALSIIWAILIILINWYGFDIFVNLYFWLIPPIVYSCGRRWYPAAPGWRKAVVQIVPIVILAALWFTQYDQHMFIDIRDRLLLSNPLGERINTFYYRYTLYAAEAFKAPSQKSINTSMIDKTVAGPHRQPLSRALARLDWLPVASEQTADLVIVEEKDRLKLIQADRVITKSSVTELMSQTGKILEQFSNMVDRHRLFRLICFYGLMIGFPILLYMGFFTLVRMICRLFVDTHKSHWAASATCLLIGVIVWGFFQCGRTDAAAGQALTSSLAEQNWRIQVAELRKIRRGSLDVMRLPAYQALKTSARVPVRYWLVEALSTSVHPQAFGEMIFFLTDPSLNVRTRACQVLGLRRDRRAIPELIKRLNQSDEWYFQWYAYRALKAVGWNQTVLD